MDNGIADFLQDFYFKFIDSSRKVWYNKDNKNMGKVIVTVSMQVSKPYETVKNSTMDILLAKLDEAIDDMEEGRVQPIDEAWKEIDAI